MIFSDEPEPAAIAPSTATDQQGEQPAVGEAAATMGGIDASLLASALRQVGQSNPSGGKMLPQFYLSSRRCLLRCL